MYECPNCAGNLVFDIPSQQLHCRHCDTKLNPYAFQKEQDAEEEELFDVTVFFCPQCGGELMTEDTTAATFCSYCGASTILDSRISREMRPKSIIPFKKTREECRLAYKRLMQRAFWAPKELKDPANIERFRGIYMPYWVYSFSKHGDAVVKGETQSKSDGMIHHKHYKITLPVDAEYANLTYDASSTFYDNLSHSIGPFQMDDMQPFTPAFLSGFYADSSDLDSSVYLEDAEQTVMNHVKQEIAKLSSLSNYHVKEQNKSATMSNCLRPEQKKETLAMLPVWFLSYRKKDRVAYAIINGQTGESAADLPIDGKSFALGSLLMTIPIFLLLNLCFSFTPSGLLALCALIASVFAFVTNSMTTDMLFKESYPDHHLFRLQRVEAVRQKEKWSNFCVGILAVLIELPFVIGIVLSLWMNDSLYYLCPVVALIVVIYLGMDLTHLTKPVLPHYTDIKTYQDNWQKKALIMLKPFAAMLICTLIIVINPVSDSVYYTCAASCIALLIWCICDMIRCHNILSTRPLPQLNKRGGEENV